MSIQTLVDLCGTGAALCPPLLQLPWWIIQPLRCGDKTHSVWKADSTSSAKCSGAHASTPLLPPFPAIISFSPVLRIPWVKAPALGGRMKGASKAGRPFVLAGCGASHHPSLSEATIPSTRLYQLRRTRLPGIFLLNGAFTQYWLARQVSQLVLLGSAESRQSNIFSLLLGWGVSAAGEWKTNSKS